MKKTHQSPRNLSRNQHHLRCLLTAASLLTTATAMNAEPTAQANTFGKDAAFLKEHTDAVILSSGDAAIVVVPEYQGRVMTATADGEAGASSGWINYDLVKQGVLPEEESTGLDRHMYAFGGEERFWLGPEGGQYSIYFAPDVPFTFDNWFTPDPIDNLPWKVLSRDNDSITTGLDFNLRNYSGTDFSVRAEREVRLLARDEIARILDTDLPEGIRVVAYQSDNRLTNTGEKAWTEESGLLSIWMLCMFQPSPETVVFIPYNEGPVEELGPIVNDSYFGKVPPDRLKVDNGLILFVCDGKSRGKIGLPPGRSSGLAGSYDPQAGRLTLLTYSQPNDTRRYVNSEWKLQDNPYAGDAVNSYNDGPVDDTGEQMGPFYELESSSPALALQPGETATHTQQVSHLYGSREELETVFHALTGLSLDVFGQMKVGAGAAPME